MLSSDDDDFGGIVPVRRRLPGASDAPLAVASQPAAAAPSAASVAAAASAGPAAIPSILGSSSASASANKLRSAFARESDEVIEARKVESRRPLVRRYTESAADASGGTPSEEYYENDEIPIPTRPEWRGLTPQQLEVSERRYFDQWLENIFSIYGPDRLNAFEMNLEVWRQLWRVCERSDILLLIVDSRQPLLNFPPSLYHYITRTLGKPMVLVLNKIDLIPQPTLHAWIEYFHRKFPKLYVVPFTSYPQERRDKIDHLVKSKVKRGRGQTLLKPYGAAELLDACRRIVESESSGGALAGLPEEVRRNFSFDPTLLAGSGGSHAVDKAEQMYADADEYMRVGTQADDGADLGSSSLSKELNQLGVLKKLKAQQRKKTKAAQLERANAAARDDASSDDDVEHPRGSKKKMSKRSASKGKSAVAAKDSKKSVRMVDEPDEVHAYDAADSEADEEEAAIVAANSAAYSGVLGRLEDLEPGARREGDFITLGCIGQPNAGKSSLINALAGKKLVSVSKTPGHSKYLQTLFLNKSTRLCDCPGLVCPAVDMPRAVQVLAGSFPIAQTRDPYTAVRFLAERVPIERIYKLMPPVDAVAEAKTSTVPSSSTGDETSSASVSQAYEWSAWSICEALALKKGFLNRKGEPDAYRAANFILREVLDGVITLFFTPPHALAQSQAH